MGLGAGGLLGFGTVANLLAPWFLNEFQGLVLRGRGAWLRALSIAGVSENRSKPFGFSYPVTVSPSAAALSKVFFY